MSAPRAMPLGPLTIDIAGTALDAEDRRRLLHPLTGGDHPVHPQLRLARAAGAV